MRKVLFLSDTHEGARYLGIPETEHDAAVGIAAAVRFAGESGYTHVLFSGDVFDTNKPTPVQVSRVAEAISYGRTEYGLEFYGIAGDHDKALDGHSWSRIVGIRDDFPDWIVGVHYHDNPDMVLAQLESELSDKFDTVEFVLLHGQVPELFKFCEAKKTLPLKQLKLCQYPRLKGVCLGDIHLASDSSFSDPECGDHSVYVGYIGSLLMLKSDELSHDKRYLVHDGTQFDRVSYEPPRDIFDVKLAPGDAMDPLFRSQLKGALSTVATSAKPLTPVLVLRYPRQDEEALASLIHDIPQGFIVRSYQLTKDVDKDAPVITEIRSELKTDVRISEALAASCSDPQARQVCWEMLMADKRGDDFTAVINDLQNKMLQCD